MAFDVVWLAAVKSSAFDNNVCRVTDFAIDTLSDARVVMHHEDGTVVDPSEHEMVDDGWLLVPNQSLSSNPRLPPGLTPTKVACHMSQESTAEYDYKCWGAQRNVGTKQCHVQPDAADDDDVAVLNREAAKTTEPCDKTMVCKGVDLEEPTVNFLGNFSGMFYCEACNVSIHFSKVRRHYKGLKHSANAQSKEREARWRLKGRPRGPDLRSD